MIKILFVHSNTAIGGATNSLLFNVISLPKDKFDVKVLFLDGFGLASELFEKNNVNIDHLTGIVNYQHAENGKIKWFSKKPWRPITQFIKMLISVNSITDYLKNNSFDIIHINTSVMLPVGIAAKKLGIKTVWHIREPIARGVFGIRRHLVRNIIISCSSKIIAISKQDAKALGDKTKTEVIYNYVDFSVFNKNINKNYLHKQLKIDENVKLITTLGGMVHSKGTDVFVNSMKSILFKHANVHFIIVGYPPKQPKGKSFNMFSKKNISEKCLNIIHRNNLNDRITFLGLRNDIPLILNSSYILVWPSTIGHFARPIIEAQAMGVPTVSTSFDSTHEIVENFETGLVFKNRDSNDLADKVNLLLDNYDLYCNISNQAYKQSKQLFNKEINIQKIINIYFELLK